MTPLTSDAWIEVSRPALRHNFQAIQSLLAETTPAPQIIAVVKANAFGHGAVKTAQAFQNAGADFFAVTTLDEALELRSGGIAARILVFLPPLPHQCEIMTAQDLDVTISDEATLSILSEVARRQGKTAQVHLKVDTGMGRLGALPEQALALARSISAADSVTFAGIYTHFARALDADPEPTEAQFMRFHSLLDQLTAENISVGLRHCTNSASLVRFPAMRLDAVRPGTILYGQYPSAHVPRQLDLQDTWRMQARVMQVRDVPSGTAVGYGSEYVTRRASRLAVLPVGYADGFTVAPSSTTAGLRGIKHLLRSLSGRGETHTVTLHGRKVPVVGRVAMQMCILDVTDIPDVTLGEIATVPMRRLMASARLPRVYLDANWAK